MNKQELKNLTNSIKESLQLDINFLLSEDNLDKDNKLIKIGSNDREYKISLQRNIKSAFSVIGDEDVRENLISELTGYFVTELTKNNLWKQSRDSFESKILIKLDFNNFLDEQFKKHRLIIDNEYQQKYNRKRYLLQDSTTQKRYVVSLNVACIDNEAKVVPVKVTK